jgi:hypothetical protein
MMVFFFKRGKKEGRRETMEKTNCGGVDLSQLALLPSCLFSTSTPDQLPLSLFLSLPLSLALSLSLARFVPCFCSSCFVYKILQCWGVIINTQNGNGKKKGQLL